MSTRAIQYLKKERIAYSVVEYEHFEKGAEYASQALGFPLEKVIKTLVVDMGPKGCVLALMPGDTQLSPKKLSRVYSAKRAEMADTATAQKLTGYTVGGISPFGTQRKLPVIMEKRILQFDTVAINGGKRGVMLIMNPQDILLAADATIAEIAD